MADRPSRRSRRERRHRCVQGVRSCCAGSPNPATMSPSFRLEPRLKFVGAATWEALSGKPVRLTSSPTSTSAACAARPRRRPRARGARNRRPARPRSPRPRRRPAHQHPPRPRRCPVVFAPAMHTEMWLHPATQANVTTLRSRGSLVLEPACGGSPASTPARAGCPSPRRSSSTPSTCSAGVMHRTLRDLPAAASSSRPAAPASHSTRCGSSAIARRGSRAWPSPPPPVARGAEVDLVAANVVDADHRTASPCTRSAPPSSCATLSASCSVGADAVVMAAAPADFRPATAADHKIKKRDDGATPTSSWSRTRHPGDSWPTVAQLRFPCSSASRPRPATRRQRPRARASQARPQGLRPPGRQRRQRRRSLRPGRQPRR